MDVDEQDDLPAPPTVVDAPKDVSASMWLVLALGLIAAVIVLRFERIDAWFAPRMKTAMAEVQPSMPAARAPDAGKPIARPRVQRAPDMASDATPRHAAPPPVAPPSPAAVTTPVAPPAPVAVTSAPVETPASLPPLKHLYSVSTATPQARGPEGHAGIVEALRAGTLRPATGADIARWQSQYARTHGRSPGTALHDRMRMTEAYVIKGDMTLPGGLHGAHAVLFLLDEGVPYPRGDAGHSAILDLGSGACVGVMCGSLLEPQ